MMRRLGVVRPATWFRPRPLASSHSPSQRPRHLPSSQSRSYASDRAADRSTFRNILLGATIGFVTGLGYLYLTDTRSSIHRWLVVPLIRTIWPDAEDAHHAGVRLLKELHRLGLHPRERGRDPESMAVEVFGQTLVNPLGVSSGLDKHGEIPSPLLALGPALVEIGGVTAMHQKGNERPRVFRILSQEGMINRYGLNSDGAELVAARLRQRVRRFASQHGYGRDDAAERYVLDGNAGVPPGSLIPGKLLAVQVAKNSTTQEGDVAAIGEDYARATSLLAPYADIIVANVSCPNVGGYRELQQIEPLTQILTAVVRAASNVDRKTRPAVMVKVSPDEASEEQVASICAAVWAAGVDGVVCGNTTTARASIAAAPDLSAAEAITLKERGGYSGPQMFSRTLDLVKKYRRFLDYPLNEPAAPQDGSSTGSSQSPDVPVPPPATRIPKVIFATGGITTGEQALEVLHAGASVAQVYTALVYGGVGKITAMKEEMRTSQKALPAETAMQGSR